MKWCMRITVTTTGLASTRKGSRLARFTFRWTGGSWTRERGRSPTSRPEWNPGRGTKADTRESAMQGSTRCWASGLCITILCPLS